MRDRYIANLPANFFMDIGRTQASPLSAWLRVPLSWYHSTTYALFDDETHSSIRRVYTSPRDQHAKRHFCGFCGTPLSYWSESPPSEADYISLTLGSLSGSDLRDLDELGLLPKEALAEHGGEDRASELPPTLVGDGVVSGPDEAHDALPWFESMIEGSNLGRVRRSRGKRQTGDGRFKMEWEVIELMPDDEAEGDSQATGKRKLGEVSGNDTVMEGVH